VRLHAPARALVGLRDFYSGRLGFERLQQPDEAVAFEIGAARLEFLPSSAEAFHHFALLVPGNRFAQALAWAGERAKLLPDRTSGEVVFDFSHWRAQACYFHDPAGNIVELIAHAGIGETDAVGSFTAEELLGMSELGLVGATAAMAGVLERRLALELWDGTVEEGRLAFVGERARTLILAPAGRPWLPTERPAEAHPAEVVLSGSPRREVRLEQGYRIARAGS